jgi:penicillin-binding protein 2
MPRDTQQQKSLTRRALILAGGQVLGAAALAGRLYQLQVLEKDRYRVMADENRINLRLLVPPRGRILDRFGIEMADNHQNYRVVIVPEQTADIEATLNAIAGLINLTDVDRHRALRDAKRQHTFIPVEVRSNLD